MTARVDVTLFGWTVATINLDIGLGDDAPGTPNRPPVTRGVKAMSNWWVRRMNA